MHTLNSERAKLMLYLLTLEYNSYYVIGRHWCILVKITLMLQQWPNIIPEVHANSNKLLSFACDELASQIFSGGESRGKEERTSVQQHVEFALALEKIRPCLATILLWFCQNLGKLGNVDMFYQMFFAPSHKPHPLRCLACRDYMKNWFFHLLQTAKAGCFPDRRGIAETSALYFSLSMHISVRTHTLGVFDG